MNINKKINTWSKHYKEKYGFRVFKIGLSTGIDCPNRQSGGCIFCVQNTFVDDNFCSYGNPAIVLDITSQIDYLIKKLKSKVKSGGYIAYFQDNTSLHGDPDYLFSLFKAADEHPEILELIFSTRPDCLPESILNKLTKLNKPITIEIGIQTTNDKSLKFLNRGHTQADNQRAIENLLKYSFKIGVHIILGIPGETKEDIDRTLDWINSNKVISDVKIHHLAVFKGAKLAEMIEKKDMIDLDSYLVLLAYFVQNLRKDLTISRLFTSNLNRQQIMLNAFPGVKRMWLNRFVEEMSK